MDNETRARFGTLEGWIDALRSAEGFYPGAEGFRIGPIRLFIKAVGDDYHIFQREEDGTEYDLTDALSLQGTDVSETAPTAAQVLVYDATLEEWVPASSSTPGAHALGGAAHTADTLANLNTKVSDATLDTSTASRPPSGGAGGDLGGTYPNPTVDDGADSTAIHDNVANEITGITNKNPVAADEFVVEDSAASYVKKAVLFSALEAALTHDNLVAGTIASHDTGATGAELDTLTDGSTAGGLHVHVAAEVTDLTTLATDVLWAARGDLAKGTGDDAADILSIGAAYGVLSSDGTDPSWTTTPRLVNLSVGAAINAAYLIYSAGTYTLPNVSSAKVGLYALPTGDAQNNVNMVAGVAGTAYLKSTGGSPLLAMCFGLDFQAAVQAYTSTIYYLVGAALKVDFGASAWSKSAGIAATLWVRAPVGGAAATIDTMHGILIEDPSGTAAAPTTTYGLKMEDITGGTNKRLLEIGPATPYLRLVGGSDPAAGDTNLYVKVGGSLLQVYSDGGTLKVK